MAHGCASGNSKQIATPLPIVLACNTDCFSAQLVAKEGLADKALMFIALKALIPL